MSDEPDPALDAVDGVMQVLQVLVVGLIRTGALDPTEYARLLLDWRRSHVAPESVQQAVVDRMLDMLSERSDVLIRRSEIRAVAPTPAAPRPGDESVP